MAHALAPADYYAAEPGPECPAGCRQAQGHAADVAHPGETKQHYAALASGSAVGVGTLVIDTPRVSAGPAELVALRVRHLRPARVLLKDHRAKHHQPVHLRGWSSAARSR